MKFGIVQGRLIQSPPGMLQWFPQDFWEHELFLAGSLGFSYVELIAERQHNPANPLWTDAGLARILALCERIGLECYSFCNDFIIEHDLRGAVEQSCQLLRQGARLGMKKLVFPLFERSELTVDNWPDYQGALIEVADCAARQEILLCLETNLPAGQLVEFLDRCDHGALRVVFDTGNRATLGHDLPEEIRQLTDYLEHIHLKDKNKSAENVHLGTGLVEFDKTFSALAGVGYQGGYTFETTRGCSPVETARFNLQFASFFMQEASARRTPPRQGPSVTSKNLAS